MLQALYGGDSSPEVGTISSFTSSDDMFLLEELDEAIETAVLEAGGCMQTPYFADTYHQQGSLNGIIRGDYESTASTGLQMGQITSRTHDGIIHVKEAKKENVLSYVSPVSASAPEIHFLGQEKVALLPLFPHSFPPMKTRLLTSQPPVSPIKMSPLRTLSQSLPSISPLDTIRPSLLLPTPSKLSSLPSLSPILPPIPSKLPPLPSLPSCTCHALLSQTSPLEPLPSIPLKCPPLPSLTDSTHHTPLSEISPALEALISTPSPLWYHLPALDLHIRAGLKNRVAPLPPILSQASQENVDNIEEVREPLSGSYQSRLISVT
ncbi:Golgi reassembly-stacking protein 2-like [Engraulis encrasicolus]|uniref:Golgi reassembly-stacking protein 2-like n=1 Tax=Engraulis encrasicolus TaxID=184585 RepID=UPI002FD6C9A4